ncbi:hypothetical protein [Teredinibacter franksiae]|nr:hypothetical protein [Teredinibacter franksiae]
MAYLELAENNDSFLLEKSFYDEGEKPYMLHINTNKLDDLYIVYEWAQV